MDERIAYWGSVLLSAVSLVLIVTTISLSNSNRELQKEVAQRQNTITAGQALGQLNQSLVSALAEAAYKNNNLEVRDLLSSQGITLRADEAAAKPEKK